MAAERPSFEPLFGENAQETAQWDNVVTSAVVDANLMFERTELGDWAFDEIKAPPRDPHGQMRHRETLKLMALNTELAAALSKLPPKKKRAAPRARARPDGADGDGEGAEDEPAPGEDEPVDDDAVGADKPAPLKKVVMTMVYEKAAYVHAMLRRNAADPDVADYDGVAGVAYYLVLHENAYEAVKKVLPDILERNRRYFGMHKDEPSKLERLKRAGLEAVRGSFKPYNEKGGFSYHHRRPVGGVSESLDWGRALVTVEDFVEMMCAVYPGFQAEWQKGAGYANALDMVARALTMCCFTNDSPDFYGFPAGSVLPLRRDRVGDEIVFGGITEDGDGPAQQYAGRVSYGLTLSDLFISQRSHSKATRAPLLRLPSKNPRIRAMERVAFSFLDDKPSHVHDGNREGGIKLFQLHMAEKASAWVDLSKLAPPGTVLVRVSAEDPRELEAPEIGCGCDDDSDSDEDAAEERRGAARVATWVRDALDDYGLWRLKHAYDTAEGQTCREPKGKELGLRLLQVQPCLYPDPTGGFSVAGVLLGVEPYSCSRSMALPLDDSGHVLMPEGALSDGSDGAGEQFVGAKRKRPARLLTITHRDGSTPDISMVWMPMDWARVGREHKWRPKRHISWRLGGQMVRVVEVQANSAGATLLFRDVMPVRWATLPTNVDGQVVIPTPHEQRKASARRTLAEFHEVWRASPLLPGSYVVANQWMTKFLERVKNQGMPRGWDYAHSNLNPQMNFLAALYRLLDHSWGVRLYHTEGIMGLLALQHVSKNLHDAKPLHQIWSGLAGTGKSYLLSCITQWVVPGVVQSTNHITDQRDSADAPNMDANTSGIAMTFEEMLPELVSLQETSGVNIRAKNAMSQRAVEMKDRLTSRHWMSIYLQFGKDGSRQRKVVQFNNDCVWVMLTNNFANLAPAMRRRFNIIPFYSYRRLDADVANARPDGEELKRLREDSSQLMQLVYLRQVQFECLVYVGAMRDVPLDGWNELVKLFKVTLRNHHPTLAANLPMETIISDAREYLRMFVIKHAVYATFGHPRAPHRDPGSFKLEQFHFTERMLTPSMSAMILALSMIEERVFPSNEKLILRAATQRVVARLNTDSRDVDLLHTAALAQWEMSSADYIASMRNGISAPPAVRTGVPPPWRSLAALKDRLDGLAPNKEEQTVDELPSLGSTSSNSEVERLLEYVTVFEKTAPCIQKFQSDAVEEFCKVLNSREDGKMEHEHMEKSLGELLQRVVRGTRPGGKPGVDHTAAVIEEAGMSGVNKVYRLCVSKSILDMLREDKLSMKTLLQQTACRLVPPGVYPVAAAYNKKTRSGGVVQDGHLPQLPAVFMVPDHSTGCPALERAAARIAEVKAEARCDYEAARQQLAELKGVSLDERDHREVERLELACMHASQRERFAWADRECVEGLGCKCFRKKIVSRDSSYEMPDLETKCYVLNFGDESLPAEARRKPRRHSRRADRAGSSSREPPVEAAPFISYCEIGWLAHVKAVMGRPWEQLTDEERELLAPAHPEASSHWLTSEPNNEKYPEALADQYVQALQKRQREMQRQERDVLAISPHEESEIVDMDEA